jgi:hypothetical protein
MLMGLLAVGCSGGDPDEDPVFAADAGSQLPSSDANSMVDAGLPSDAMQDVGTSEELLPFADDACTGAPITLAEAEQSLGSLGFYQFALRIRECEIDTDVCEPWEYQSITDLSWSTMASGVVKLAHSSGGGEIRLWLENSKNCDSGDSYKYVGASCTGLGGTLTCVAYHSCDDPLELITYQGWVNDTRYARFTGKLTSDCVQLKAHSSLDYLGTSGDYGPRYEREAAILLSY